MYDAFETPRAVRGRRGAARPRRRRSRTWTPCASGRWTSSRAAVPTRSCTRWCCATSSSTRRRCARSWRWPASCPPASRPPRGVRSGRLDRRPGGLVRHGRRAGGVRVRQRAPAPCRRAARLPPRPPAGDQRHLAALRGGRRLRAARVVDGRGLGVEGAVRHHARSRRRGRGPARSRVPRLLVRGRRPGPLVWSTAPHRGRVGAGGDLGPDGDGGRRAGVGVDRHGVPRLSGLPPVPLSGSTPRSSSAIATASCAAARGPRIPAWPRRPSATGTCPSGGRSSPACGSPPRAERAASGRAPRPPTAPPPAPSAPRARARPRAAGRPRSRPPAARAAGGRAAATSSPGRSSASRTETWRCQPW